MTLYIHILLFLGHNDAASGKNALQDKATATFIKLKEAVDCMLCNDPGESHEEVDCRACGPSEKVKA
jgi:hypothetical protein